MKNLLLFLCILSIGCTCQSGPLYSDAPEEQERIQRAVEVLGWNSYSMSHSGPSPGQEESSYLVEAGTVSSTDLVSVLRNADQGVAAHIVLSYIWNCRHEYRERIIYEEDHTQILGFDREFDGLRWSWRKPDLLYANPEDLKKNAERWRSRLGLK